ncbi:uncharacterized protein LOC143031980 [Oratosquilla oratoria]|uniref:uncharacterized protein LOC143031980 n=1 Tax=Oratosquilla oratoria TaxID=337810 RepID=UPI003F76DFF7
MITARKKWREEKRRKKVEIFREEENRLRGKHKNQQEVYEKNPESHPHYKREWRQFWQLRYQKLESQGCDASMHNFKREWVPFWFERMKELGEEDYAARRENLLLRLGIPDPEKPEDGKDSGVSLQGQAMPAGQTSEWEPKENAPRGQRSPSPWEEDFALRSQAKNPSPPRDLQQQVMARDPAQVFREPDLSVIGTLKVLNALEDQLGSFGPAINTLLEKAENLLTQGENAKQLFKDGDNVVLVRLAKEKLSSQVAAGILGMIPLSRTQLAVERAQWLLMECEKMNKKPDYFGLDINAVAGATVGLDSVQVAQTIANCLLKLGKSNVNDEDLHNILMAVSAAHASLVLSQSAPPAQVPTMPAAAAAPAAPTIPMAPAAPGISQVTQQSPQPQQQQHTPTHGEGQPPPAPPVLFPSTMSDGKNGAPPDGKTGLKMLQMAYSDSIPKDMEKLSLEDLQELLSNFHALNKEEQHALTAYLKKLEATDKNKVSKLREAMHKNKKKLAAQQAARQPPPGSSGSRQEPSAAVNGRIQPDVPRSSAAAVPPVPPGGAMPRLGEGPQVVAAGVPTMVPPVAPPAVPTMVPAVAPTMAVPATAPASVPTAVPAVIPTSIPTSIPPEVASAIAAAVAPSVAPQPKPHDLHGRTTFSGVLGPSMNPYVKPPVLTEPPPSYGLPTPQTRGIPHPNPMMPSLCSERPPQGSGLPFHGDLGLRSNPPFHSSSLAHANPPPGDYTSHSSVPFHNELSSHSSVSDDRGSREGSTHRTLSGSLPPSTMASKSNTTVSSLSNSNQARTMGLGSQDPFDYLPEEYRKSGHEAPPMQKKRRFESYGDSPKDAPSSKSFPGSYGDKQGEGGPAVSDSNRCDNKGPGGSGSGGGGGGGDSGNVGDGSYMDCEAFFRDLEAKWYRGSGGEGTGSSPASAPTSVPSAPTSVPTSMPTSVPTSLSAPAPVSDTEKGWNKGLTEVLLEAEKDMEDMGSHQTRGGPGYPGRGVSDYDSVPSDSGYSSRGRGGRGRGSYGSVSNRGGREDYSERDDGPSEPPPHFEDESSGDGYNWQGRGGPGGFGDSGNGPSGPGGFGDRGSGPSGPGGFGDRGSGPGGFGDRGSGPSGPGGFGDRGSGPSGPGGFGDRGSGLSGPGGFGDRGSGPSGPGGFGDRGSGPSGSGGFGDRGSGMSGLGGFGDRSSGPPSLGNYGDRNSGPSGPGGFGDRSSGPYVPGGFGDRGNVPYVPGNFGNRGNGPSGPGGFGNRGSGPSGPGGFGNRSSGLLGLGSFGDRSGPGSFGDRSGTGGFGDRSGPGNFGDRSGPSNFSDRSGPGNFGERSGPGSFGESGNLLGGSFNERSGAGSFGDRSSGSLMGSFGDSGGGGGGGTSGGFSDRGRGRGRGFGNARGGQTRAFQRW